MEARVWDNKRKSSTVKSSRPKEDIMFFPFRDGTFIVQNIAVLPPVSTKQQCGLRRKSYSFPQKHGCRRQDRVLSLYPLYHYTFRYKRPMLNTNFAV
jgi:hypothetical protein